MQEKPKIKRKNDNEKQNQKKFESNNLLKQNNKFQKVKLKINKQTNYTFLQFALLSPIQEYHRINKNTRKNTSRKENK